MLKFFFVSDDESSGDCKMLWQALQYHLRGLVPSVPWDDARPACPIERILEKVLDSAMVVVVYGPGDPNCGSLTFGPRTAAAINAAQEYGIDYVVMMPYATFASRTQEARKIVEDLLEQGKREEAERVVKMTTYRVDDFTRVPLDHLTMSFDMLLQKIVNVATVKSDEAG